VLQIVRETIDGIPAKGLDQSRGKNIRATLVLARSTWVSTPKTPAFPALPQVQKL